MPAIACRTAPANTTVAPFDNSDVRLALKYAIDRVELLQKVLRGQGTLANDHPIAPSVPFHADLEQRKYDPDKAKFHLKQAGLENLRVDLSAADGTYAGTLDGAVLRQEHAATVAELCDRFMADYVPSHCKASTQKEYHRNVELFIKPGLGPIKAADIERRHIAELHHKHRAIPYQANRTLGVLSVMFNQAEVWGLRPDGSNPCRHVKKYEEKKRDRYLTAAELERLGKTLLELEAAGTVSQAAINAIRLLILTGCRLSEIQTLKWDYLQGDSLWLPDSKTGDKRVYLGPAALEALAAIERQEDNPYIIPGKLPGTHLTDLQRPWRRIRRAAKLEDLRIHDLRHSFASSGVGLGESLPMIGKLLGHSQVQTTARYAHLADDPVKAAVARISSEIGRLMNGEKAPKGKE